MESPVPVAIMMFIFMGTMPEKSGAARDLLFALQVLALCVAFPALVLRLPSCMLGGG